MSRDAAFDQRNFKLSGGEAAKSDAAIYQLSLSYLTSAFAVERAQFVLGLLQDAFLVFV